MTNSDDDEIYEYKNRPEENEIFEDLEIKLREIDGWYEYKEKWSDYISKYIRKHGIEQSLDCVLAIWFGYEIERDFNLNVEMPSAPDEENITADKVEKYRQEFKKYLIELKAYTDKILELAPEILPKVDKGNIANINIQNGDFFDLDEEEEGEDPKKLMNMAFSYNEKGDKDTAIEYLKRSYEAYYESDKTYSIDYTINDFIRLPLYMHQAGYKEEAWETFNKFLKGYFPVRTSEDTLTQGYDLIKTWECEVIYDKMRISSDREKHYKQSLIYRCLQDFYGAASMYFQGKNDDLGEGESYEISYSKERLINDYLPSSVKKAKVEEDLEKLADLILKAIKELPDFKKGEKIIISGTEYLKK